MSDFDVKSPLRPLVSMRYLETILGHSREELRYCASNSQHLYRPFDLPKKSGRGSRRIDSPQQPLKGIQARINQKIFSHMTFPIEIVGSVRGRSVRDHAKRHIGKRVLTTLDIQDFFGNVTADKVRRSVLNALECSSRIADILVGLTTYKGRLPQGASTSPTLANLAILPLIRDIANMLGASGETSSLSAWCDDIVISGENAHEFIGSVVSLAKIHGFRINPKKIKTMMHGQLQSSIGVVLNRKISYGSTRISALMREITGTSAVERRGRLKSLAYHIRFLDNRQGEKILARLNSPSVLD